MFKATIFYLLDYINATFMPHFDFEKSKKKLKQQQTNKKQQTKTNYKDSNIGLQFLANGLSFVLFSEKWCFSWKAPEKLQKNSWFNTDLSFWPDVS